MTMTVAANKTNCSVKLLAKPPDLLSLLCIAMMTSLANAIAKTVAIKS